MFSGLVAHPGEKFLLRSGHTAPEALATNDHKWSRINIWLPIRRLFPLFFPFVKIRVH